MDAQDNKGWTALIRASYNGYASVVRLLLGAGDYTIDHNNTES